LGVTITNGLQVFLPLAAMLVTQVGRWRGISWGVKTTNVLQVFLPPAVVPVTQAGRWRGVSWGHGYKWPSSFFTTCSHVDYSSWMLEGRQLGAMTPKWRSNDPLRGC